MCTMTWFKTEQGYELFFNRDEQLSRQRALLPTFQSEKEVAYVSPTDADAGGTWIALNQFGVTVCLLNHYQFQQIETYKDWTSRGEIVRSFATISSTIEAKRQFEILNLDMYRAFRLFIIERSGKNALFIWDGHKARIEYNVKAPKSSSSVNAKSVKAGRIKQFYDAGLDKSTNVSDYLQYHSSHNPDKSERSVCMHRADAQTVSFTHVSVDKHQANLAYLDGSPCEGKLAPPLSLDLVDSSELELVSIAR